MKRLIALVSLTFVLTGCLGVDEELEQIMTFRASLLSGMGCSFDAIITADYRETIYTFGLSCRGDELGNLSFVVTEPESISGISGRIDADGGEMTFDHQALAFECLTDEQLSPISAPWLMLKVLRGGYITSCTEEDGKLRVSLNDSFEADALKADVWLDDGDRPVYAEFLWKERKILSLEVKNFEIL